MTNTSRLLPENLTLDRQQRIAQIRDQGKWDLIIIGGGITGAGILKLASQIGIKVLLLEQKDFAWGSSSRSSKMVHGGLRYMAQGDVKLTLESVKERQRLITEGSQLITEQSFVMSHYKYQFPWPWLFNLLLDFYDFFSGLKRHKFWKKSDYLSLVPQIKEESLLGGTQFTDALTDDARLVQRLIQEAKYLDGQALNYARVTSFIQKSNRITGVNVQLEGEVGNNFELEAKVVVNATGAWSDLLKTENKEPAFKMRPLRGSHLVIPSWRLPVASAVSILHPEDKRPVQIYPWQNVTLVGTTDVEHGENINSEARISRQEFDYLMECIKHQFPKANIAEKDIISTFSGIRPVIAGGGFIAPSQEKRDHSIFQSPGLITVTGGKLTTFRLIAEQVMTEVAKHLGLSLKGFRQAIFEPYEEKQTLNICHKTKQLQACYGILAKAFVQQSAKELFQPIGYSRHLWAELVWAVKYEQVVHLDDLMLRRTRLGNVLPNGAKEYLSHIRKLCQPFLNWGKTKWQQEISRYLKIWQSSYSLPSKKALSQTEGND